MKVSAERVKKLCEEQGLSVSQLLKEAGVSKNAYYCLARKDTVLPGSLMRIAARLEVEPSALLTGL